MDPWAPSLEFVRDREKTQQFLRELTDVGLSKSEVVYELPTVCMQVLVIMPQVGVDGLVGEESFQVFPVDKLSLL